LVKINGLNLIGLILGLTAAICTASFIVNKTSAQMSTIPQCKATNTTGNATRPAVPTGAPGSISVGRPSVQICDTSCCAACTRCVNTGDCTACYANSTSTE
jgi:hypothetical protein